MFTFYDVDTGVWFKANSLDIARFVNVVNSGVLRSNILSVDLDVILNTVKLSDDFKSYLRYIRPSWIDKTSFEVSGKLIDAYSESMYKNCDGELVIAFKWIISKTFWETL